MLAQLNTQHNPTKNNNQMLIQLKKIWHLGLPLCITFVIQMGITMVDSAFAGNISYTDLAAVSLGSNTFNVLLLCMIGICIASSVKAGQALGAGDNKAMLNCFRQGSLLCIVIGLFFSILLLFSDSFMISLGQEADVVELTKSYLYWFSWTLPLQAMIILIRSYFAVIDQPWASVFPILLTLFLNTFLNYCLATGNLGFPAMGIYGIGLASFLSNAFLVILMLRNIGWATVRDIFSFTHPDVNKDKGLFRLLLISLPIAVTLFTEEAFFSGTVFLAGALGAAEQAAHQILFNTINTSYLFNTGIAIACSIIIGKQVGAGEFTKDHTQCQGRLGVSPGVYFTLCIGTAVFWRSVD